MTIRQRKALQTFEGLFSPSRKSMDTSKPGNFCGACGKPIVKGKPLCRKCSKES